MRIRNIITLLLLPLLATACNTDKGDAEGVVPTPVELVIRASQGVTTRASVVEDPEIVVGADLAATAASTETTTSPDTRTELGPVTGNEQQISGNEQQIYWSTTDITTDKIRVWAKNSAGDYSALNGVEFWLRSYNYAYNAADFTNAPTTSVAKMPSGTYTYYGIYPSPESVRGMTVSYDLPSEQSGNYDGSLDVMWATDVGADLIYRPETTDSQIRPQPHLDFQHLFHLMRIYVPALEGVSAERPIKQLDVTFPAKVVGGTATVDVTTGVVEWSGQGSNKLTIKLADDNLLSEGGYVWAHLRAGVELNGPITIQAYDDYGVPKKSASSGIVSKTLGAGRITPITFSNPASAYDNVTYVEINETANNLGEAWNTMTLSNKTFIKPFTYETTNSLGVTPNTTKVYKVAIAAEPSTMQGKSIAASYDSPNAIVSNSIVLPSTISNKQANVNNQVPYLFFEDFSSVTGHSQNDADETADYTITGYDLSKYGFKQYWSGARTGSGAGQSVRINSRADVVSIKLLFWTIGGETRTHGRLDSPPINSIKSGKKVNVSVSFNYDGDINGNDVFYPSAVCGYSTFNSNSYVNNSYLYGDSADILKALGVADAKTVDQWNISEPTTIPDIQTDGSYGSITQSMSYTINNCTSSHRLSWEINAGGSTASITNGAQWLYLDNIKVSIAQ